MKISEILKGDFIIPDLAAREKIGVIEELTRFLKNNGTIEDREALTQALMEREKLGSTGIGECVAIPHAKSQEIGQILVLFARSTTGVDFDSLDQKPVHFVCLVIAPTASTGHHLKALARISRLLKSESLREEILKATDASAIHAAILEEDSKFI
ncbi:MAG: PTS sugar transporter subunit IIA [Nitrospinaceae bacterium]|jgi:PTS system nitrogen regulatory IIA component|nr:MAG: PTS sugar transporter subunit IIA [Nitrospinaceae bacterium]